MCLPFNLLNFTVIGNHTSGSKFDMPVAGIFSCWLWNWWDIDCDRNSINTSLTNSLFICNLCSNKRKVAEIWFGSWILHGVSDLKTEKEIGGKSNEVVWEKYRLHLSWYSSYVLFRRIHLRKIQVEPRGCCQRSQPPIFWTDICTKSE